MPNSGTIKETEDSTIARMQLKKWPVLKQNTEVLKFYQRKENKYKKPMILLSVLVTEASTKYGLKLKLRSTKIIALKATLQTISDCIIDLSDLKEM